MARLIRRSEDVKEDLQLEVNPFAIVMKEEKDRKKTKEFEVIKTMYSKEHFDLLHSKLFYMGEKKVIVDNFHKEQFMRWEYNMFVEYKPVYKYNPSTASTSRQKAILQTLEKIEGLLDLSKYINRRIMEMSFELNPKETFKEDIDVKKIGEIRRKVLQINMERFIENNTWEIKSRTNSLRIFCPFLGVRDGYFTMKFLVYKDGEILPCIYMILLEKKANQLQKVIIEIGGEDYDFYIDLKTPKVNFGADKFPDQILYYNPDTKLAKTLPVDIRNPDDCVVVSMFMAGLLTQPDMTRYHNLFRSVDIDPVNMTFEHMLSYGYNSFVEDVMTQRIKSFFNRQDPSAPKKKIRNISIMLPLPNRRKITGTATIIKGYNAVFDGFDYWIEGYVQGNTRAQDEQYLTQLLTDLGCNHINSVIPVTIIGHQLYMTYDGAAYHLHDPQVNEYIDNILDHTNHGSGDIPFLGLFCIETSEPGEAMVVVPEMPLLYEACRLPHQYKDDLYPTVNQAVAYFSQYNEFSFPDPMLNLIELQENVLPTLGSILSIRNNLTLRESARMANDLLSVIQLRRLAALQHPSPSVSIDKVYHIEKSLQRTFEQMSSFDGLRSLRLATSEYYKQNIDVIMKGVQGIFFSYIDEREVYDLLLSKPFFVGFQNFFLKEYPQDAKLFLDDLIEYIRSTNKPVLHLVHMFIEIRRMARDQGLEDQILSYLSYFDTIELKSLYDLAQRLIVKLSEVSGSQDQMTEVLFQTFVDYSTRFFQSPLSIGRPLPKVPKRELKYAIPGFLEQRPRYEIRDAREVSINALSIFIMLMNIVKYGSDLKNQYLGNK
jgi:hypothetical protein